MCNCWQRFSDSCNASLSSPFRPLSLINVLITPQIVKNLISVRKFTRDNFCSVEFDPFGFTVKDLHSRVALLRSNSSGDLYSIPSSLNQRSNPSTALLSFSPNVWHKRLAHLNNNFLFSLRAMKLISCNNDNMSSSCEACQLGKQIKLSFSKSVSSTSKPFDIIHSDIWTSPLLSVSGYKYYLIFLDSHFLWVFPLRRKSEVFSKFLQFYKYVETQFNTRIKALQCDNGGEYQNTELQTFFLSNGIQFRFTCPHTSQQNGKSERMIRTINNSIRCLLFQAHLSPGYWVEALHTAVHLLNILPSVAIQNKIPYAILFKQQPRYDHLRVFGCLCFPNLNYSNLSKLAPRSTPCLFLGYPAQHRGYLCLDLKTRKLIISRHVFFDESVFPAAEKTTSSSSYHFLQQYDEPSPIFKAILQKATTTNAPSPVASVPATETSPPLVQQSPVPQPIAMRTRGKAGISKPKKQFSLLSSVSPIPKSHKEALQDPNWTPEMNDAIDAFIETKTWDLVPRPKNTNIVTSLWLYKHKFDADGKPYKHKVRLVANGKTQEEGVDFTETFSPVVKPVTIRTVLDVSLANGWPIHQLDVKNAFLHGLLDETIYMHQPPGYRDKTNPDYVCKLNKAIYGLKQAPRAWNSRFATFVTNMCFTCSRSDASLFIFNKGSRKAYLLLYVDDIILTASDDQFLQQIVTKLQTEFPMSDSGKLHFFLGVKAEFVKDVIFLSQQAYTVDIIARAGMTDCKPIATPVDLNSKLEAEEGDRVPDPTQYRRPAGALQYLTFTRPDIAYAVHQICLYMHDPRVPHLHALKRIIRYLQGTKAFGLQLLKGSISQLTAYSDADWAGCPDTRRSTSGYCVYLGSNVVSWSSKRQSSISRSSAEAEYKGVANVVAELTWIRNLLFELGNPISKASIVYCDNISSIYLAHNPVRHQRTKHVEIDIHFVREKVALGHVKVLFVPSSLQFADIFTKGLPSSLFNDFRTRLTV